MPKEIEGNLSAAIAFLRTAESRAKEQVLKARLTGKGADEQQQAFIASLLATCTAVAQHLTSLAVRMEQEAAGATVGTKDRRHGQGADAP